MFRTAFAIPFVLSVIVVLALTGCSNPTEDGTSKSSTPAASAKDLGATNDDQETVASGNSSPPEALQSSDLLDPSNWSLSQKSSFDRNRKTELEPGELKRINEGLQITTSSLFGEMEAKFEREFSGNFEIQMSLIHLGEDEREVAGLPRISIGRSRFLFNAGQSARAHFQFLGRDEVLRNSSEIRIRTAGGRLSVSLNGEAPDIYELFDKIPFQFGLGVSSSSRVIVSKLVINEDLPLDEALANAPITSGRGLTGMNGPLPGQGMLPPGMGPGFPPGFPPGAGIDGPPASAMGFGPGFPPTGLPNSAAIPPPKQFDPFISSGPWFVPNFEQEFDRQRAERHLNMETNGPVTKISTSAPSFGFWILRRLDLPDDSSFECRLSIPSLMDLTSVPIDPTTFLGTGILPANEALSQSVPSFSSLPPPLPNSNREINLSVSRDGDQVELAINGQSNLVSVPRHDSFFLGLYVRGGIKFDIADMTESSSQANVAAAKPGTSQTEVVFRPLEDLQSPSRFAMTEDGRYLVISHEFLHRVTIVDVFSGKEVTSINIMSPRSLLCRAGYLFVSSSSNPMIKIISQKDWKDLGSRQVRQMNIVHLSAPAAPYFGDEILVTCHDITNNQNEISGHTVLWNFRDGETLPIGNHAVSTISAQGDKVLVQNQFNDLTPKFGLYDFKEFASRSPLKDIESYNASLTPLQYFRSSNDGNFWISNQMIFTETPPPFPLH